MKILILCCILFVPLDYSFGQRNCDFSLDTLTISGNDNLQSLIGIVSNASFNNPSKKKYIPVFVRDVLDCWTGKFSILNPGITLTNELGNANQAIVPKFRQLIYLGVSNECLVMSYNKIGYSETCIVTIFKYRDSKIYDFWTGEATGNPVRNKKEILDFLKSGSSSFHNAGIQL